MLMSAGTMTRVYALGAHGPRGERYAMHCCEEGYPTSCAVRPMEMGVPCCVTCVRVIKPHTQHARAYMLVQGPSERGLLEMSAVCASPLHRAWPQQSVQGCLSDGAQDPINIGLFC